MTGNPSEWRESGVRIVRQGEFDPNTPQTPGMHREAAISRASAGAAGCCLDADLAAKASWDAGSAVLTDPGNVSLWRCGHVTTLRP